MSRSTAARKRHYVGHQTWFSRAAGELATLEVLASLRLASAQLEGDELSSRVQGIKRLFLSCKTYCTIIALIKMVRGRQLFLPVRSWGGRREGAGRKPGPRPVVLHRPRSQHKSRFPLHITLRARAEVGSLRQARLYRALEAAIAASSRSDFRLVHFSVQGDHVHLVVEAHDKPTLSRGMGGLMIRVARAVNRASGRSGPVWADRYHCRELRTPREVRHALAYVLLNARKHGREVAALDPCSSARWFDGWRDHSLVVDLALDPPAVVAPRTWLLGAGWRRHGLLRFDEVRART